MSGLVAATGVASRRIAFVVAGDPGARWRSSRRFVGVLTIMPPPVMAAALLFTAVFIMISGMQIISTRVLDARRTLVIGMGMMAFFVGVGVSGGVRRRAALGAAAGRARRWCWRRWWRWRSICVFRLGIRRKVAMTGRPGRTSTIRRSRNFVERNAAIWGARRDVATRVEFAVQQAVEAIVEFARVEGPITCEIAYDEFDIDVALAYTGKVLDLSGPRPTVDEIVESEQGAARLAGFLIRQYTDTAQAFVEDGTAKLLLRFRQ